MYGWTRGPVPSTQGFTVAFDRADPSCPTDKWASNWAGPLGDLPGAQLMDVRLNTQTTQNPPSSPENPKADNSKEAEKPSTRTG